MSLGDIPKRSFPSSEAEGALLEGAFNPRCFLLDLQSFLAACGSLLSLNRDYYLPIPYPVNSPSIIYPPLALTLSLWLVTKLLSVYVSTGELRRHTEALISFN